MRLRVGELERVSVCERERVCVCVCERERECVCVREREREYLVLLLARADRHDRQNVPLPHPSDHQLLPSCFGIRDSEFGYRFPGFDFRVLGSGFRVPTFGFRVLDSGFQIPGLGFRIPDSDSRVSGFGFRVSGFGFQLSGIGFRIPGSGFRVSGLTPPRSAPHRARPRITFWIPPVFIRRILPVVHVPSRTS